VQSIKVRLFPLDERLRFDDRVFIRKRVKRGEEQMAGPGFDGDEPQWRERKPMIGLKIVHEPALGAVAQDFIVHVHVDFLRQRFDLKARLIVELRAERNRRAMFATDPLMITGPMGRQWQLFVGRHFGEMHVPRLPRDRVARPTDSHGQFVIVAPHCALRERVEQLGVEGPIEQVKDQFTDSRT